MGTGARGHQSLEPIHVSFGPFARYLTHLGNVPTAGDGGPTNLWKKRLENAEIEKSFLELDAIQPNQRFLLKTDRPAFIICLS
jgi:hypothetical protein